MVLQKFIPHVLKLFHVIKKKKKEKKVEQKVLHQSVKELSFIQATF